MQVKRIICEWPALAVDAECSPVPWMLVTRVYWIFMFVHFPPSPLQYRVLIVDRNVAVAWHFSIHLAKCLPASKYVWDLIGGVGDKRSTGVWTHWSSHIEVVCWLELSAVVGWLVEWMLKQNSIYYYYNTSCSTTFQTIFVYYNLSIITGWLAAVSLLLYLRCTVHIFLHVCLWIGVRVEERARWTTIWWTM